MCSYGEVINILYYLSRIAYNKRVWKNYLYCVDPGESRGCFCFFLAGRRSPLTRDAILCEPEVSLVGKFRFIYIYILPIINYECRILVS